MSVGVIPGGGGTQLLARRLGWSRAADLVFTARRLDAAEADRIGLRRPPGRRPGGGAAAVALDLATAIAANSPVALRNAKRAMRVGLDLPLGAGLEVEDACWAATAFSADRAEGVRAFTERRAPTGPEVARPTASGRDLTADRRVKICGLAAFTIRRMTRVLLVEDDSAIADPLARALKREGYDVDVYGDGPSALAGADEGADLVVLDLGLPGMDGLEVCRADAGDGQRRARCWC